MFLANLGGKTQNAETRINLKVGEQVYRYEILMRGGFVSFHDLKWYTRYANIFWLFVIISTRNCQNATPLQDSNSWLM